MMVEDDASQSWWAARPRPGVRLIQGSGRTDAEPTHLHAGWQVLVLTRGRAAVRLRARTVRAMAGSVFVIAPWEPHALEPQGPISYLALHLDEAPARVTTTLHRRVTPAAAGRLAESLTAAAWAPDGRFVVPLEAPLGPNLRPASAEVQILLDRLRSDPERAVKVADLAAEVGLSRFQLHRSFRRELGLSPREYLHHLRVAAAQRLLAAGEAPAHVASRTGFADQSHLTRVFKSVTGTTPGRYQSRAVRERRPPALAATT